MSELRANTISDAAGTGPVTLTGQYAAKAWVNFNGTGTVAIRESGNVSSITDNATGDYTINFSSALTDANFVLNGTSHFTGTDIADVFLSPETTLTTTSVRINVHRVNAGDKDNPFVFVTIIR